MFVSIADIWTYFKKLSLKKCLNGLQVWISFRAAKSTKKPIQKGLPVALSIEPTTSCNLRCPECPSGLRSFTRPTGMLDQKMFSRLIDELAPTLTYLTFYFQGEPFLHPKFLDMVKYANNKSIYTATSTNAHYIDKLTAKKIILSGLNRVIISLDGTTQETYEQYRVGGKISKVLEGTKNLIEAKRKAKSNATSIVFQYLVVKPNEHQIEDAKKIAQDLGVDEILFKTAQVYNYENGNELIPSNNKYSRYKRLSNGKYQLKRKSPIDNCWRMWQSAVVTWDGDVVPCCFDKDSEHVMGNIQKESFAEIWQNNSYANFRSTLLQGRENIEMCKNCTEGTEIYYI